MAGSAWLVRLAGLAWLVWLGGAVAEVCLEHDIRPQKFRRLGINDTYVSVVGDQRFLRASVGVDCNAIVGAVRQLLAL